MNFLLKILLHLIYTLPIFSAGVAALIVSDNNSSAYGLIVAQVIIVFVATIGLIIEDMRSYLRMKHCLVVMDVAIISISSDHSQPDTFRRGDSRCNHGMKTAGLTFLLIIFLGSLICLCLQCMVIAMPPADFTINAFFIGSFIWNILTVGGCAALIIKAMKN